MEQARHLQASHPAHQCSEAEGRRRVGELEAAVQRGCAPAAMTGAMGPGPTSHSHWSLFGGEQPQQYAMLLPRRIPVSPLLRGLRDCPELPAGLAPLLAGRRGEGGIVDDSRLVEITAAQFCQQRLGVVHRRGPLSQPEVVMGMAAQVQLGRLRAAEQEREGWGVGTSRLLEVGGTRLHLHGQKQELEAMAGWLGPPAYMVTVTPPADTEQWISTRVQQWAHTGGIPWQVSRAPRTGIRCLKCSPVDTHVVCKVVVLNSLLQRAHFLKE